MGFVIGMGTTRRSGFIVLGFSGSFSSPVLLAAAVVAAMELVAISATWFWAEAAVGKPAASSGSAAIAHETRILDITSFLGRMLSQREGDLGEGKTSLLPGQLHLEGQR